MHYRVFQDENNRRSSDEELHAFTRGKQERPLRVFIDCASLKGELSDLGFPRFR